MLVASTRGVAQVVVQGVEDQCAVASDRLGEGDELGDAAAPGPGEPPGQQRSAVAPLVSKIARSCPET